MRRIILSLCVVSVLIWAAGTVLAQGQGKGKEQGGRPADRAVNPNKPGETAKVDANSPAADKMKAMSQDIEKAGKEKAKGLMERGQEQMQMRGKAAKDEVAGKLAETKAKGNEQQTRAFEKQAQQDTAKHMERQARLARIRELAVQKGDAKMIARVDELITKENQLYDRKLRKMQGQNRAGGTLPPIHLPGMQGKDKVDVNKPAETKPASQTPPPAAGTSSAGGQPAPTQEKAGEGAKPAPEKSSAPKPQ